MQIGIVESRDWIRDKTNSSRTKSRMVYITDNGPQAFKIDEDRGEWYNRSIESV